MSKSEMKRLAACIPEIKEMTEKIERLERDNKIMREALNYIVNDMRSWGVEDCRSWESKAVQALSRINEIAAEVLK